ncbi:hypothetical protein V6Z11_A11G049000 [Gossypium hirsutum]
MKSSLLLRVLLFSTGISFEEVFGTGGTYVKCVTSSIYVVKSFQWTSVPWFFPHYGVFHVNLVSFYILMFIRYQAEVESLHY